MGGALKTVIVFAQGWGWGGGGGGSGESIKF